MYKSLVAVLCDSLIFVSNGALLLNLGLSTKRTRVGFCSAKVRFHLVWSKGLERHREGERQKERGQLVTVNTANRVVPKKRLLREKSPIGLISFCIVRVDQIGSISEQCRSTVSKAYFWAQ